MNTARVEIALPYELVEEIVALVTERVLTELRRDQARRWLPVKEAAVELGVSEGALRKHIARNGVKTDRVGARIVVDMSAFGGS